MDDVYYSKSDLEEAFKKFPLNWNSFIKDTINSIEPSDVCSVVKAEWIDYNPQDKLDPRMKCSNCGVVVMPLVEDVFCPRCGAKLISEEFSCQNVN